MPNTVRQAINNHQMFLQLFCFCLSDNYVSLSWHMWLLSCISVFQLSGNHGCCQINVSAFKGLSDLGGGALLFENCQFCQNARFKLICHQVVRGWGWNFAGEFLISHHLSTTKYSFLRANTTICPSNMCSSALRTRLRLSEHLYS